MTSFAGRVSVCPWYKISKAGNGYCEFTLLDAHEKAQHCIAFDRAPFNLAKKLSDEVVLDSKITVQGSIKDGKLFVSSFILIEKLNEVHGRKFKAKEIEHTPMEVLMDKLGASYVNEKLKQFFKNTDIMSVYKTFPLEPYHELMKTLWDEAALKETDIKLIEEKL